MTKVAPEDVVVFEFKASVCRIDAAVQLLQRRRRALQEQRQLRVHLAIVLPAKSWEASGAGVPLVDPFRCGSNVHFVLANLQSLPSGARKPSSSAYISAERSGHSSPLDLQAVSEGQSRSWQRKLKKSLNRGPAALEPAVRCLDFDEVTQDTTSRTDRAERDLAFLHLGPRYGIITRNKLCKLLCMARGQSRTLKLDKDFSCRVQRLQKQL